MKQYYYLVSSLKDLSFDMDRLPYEINEFIQNVRDEINYKELKFFEAIQLQFDNKNVINYLKNKNRHTNQFIPHGICSPSQIDEDIIDGIIKGKQQSANYLPLYLWECVVNYLQEKRLYKDIAFEDEVSIFFYNYVQKLQNTFLNKYFHFDHTLRNIIAAFNVNKFALTKNNLILPINDESEILLSSRGKDFGLSGSLDWFSKVEQIFSEDNLYQRERNFEHMRFDYVDQLLEFEYFGLNVILGYLIKLTILSRLNEIKDKEIGRRKFEAVIDRLSKI